MSIIWGATGERSVRPQPFSSRPHGSLGIRTIETPQHRAVLRVPAQCWAQRNELVQPPALASRNQPHWSWILRGRTEVGALGFSLTQRAERAVAVSPAEQTKQLKVISLCSHTHQLLTKLLCAQTQLHSGSRCCRRDNKGTRCRTDEIRQEPVEGESLPASKE